MPQVNNHPSLFPLFIHCTHLYNRRDRIGLTPFLSATRKLRKRLDQVRRRYEHKIATSCNRKSLFRYTRTKNSLLHPAQHGFLNRKSYVTALLTSQSGLHKSLDDSSYCTTVLFDLSKAFDSLSIPILASKLPQYGIQGCLQRTLISFVSNRNIRVSVNNSLSQIHNLTRGVPQGTCLGPLLFILYIDSLPYHLPPSVQCVLFADDIKLYTVNDCPNMQLAIDSIHNYCSSHSLLINPSKSLVLASGNSHPTHTFKLGSHILPSATTVRDLGIFYDHSLSYKPHFDHIISKASSVSNYILRAFRTRSPSLLFTLFSTYCRPILEYGSVLWNPTCQVHIREIERVQRTFTRRAFWRTGNVPSYEGRLAILGATTLQHRRLIADLSFLYSSLFGFNDFASSQIRISPRAHLSRTHPYQIIPLRFHSAAHKSSYFGRIISVWNALPSHIVMQPNPSLFAKYASLHKFEL